MEKVVSVLYVPFLLLGEGERSTPSPTSEAKRRKPLKKPQTFSLEPEKLKVLYLK